MVDGAVRGFRGLTTGHEFPAPRLDAKAARGKNGRLFLDNDSNRVLAQQSGELRFSDAQLSQWRYVLETRIAWLARLGIDHLFMVAPNAHSVYPEDLPAGCESSIDRPVFQLIQFLEANGSYASVIYPLEELIGQRERCMFSKTETHWSELGAFIAYRRLMQELDRRIAIRPLTEDDLHTTTTESRGDLGVKVSPPESSPLVIVDVRSANADLVSDNRVFNQGRRIEYRCPEVSGEPVCLVYGDSFAVRMLPFLAETFSRTVFALVPTLDYGLVEQERPDVAICVMNERFLISVPNDSHARTLGEIAQEKLATQQVYPPRTSTGTTRVESPVPEVPA